MGHVRKGHVSGKGLRIGACAVHVQRGCSTAACAHRDAHGSSTNFRVSSREQRLADSQKEEEADAVGGSINAQHVHSMVSSKPAL